MKINWSLGRSFLVASFSLVGSAAMADQGGARYEQSILNGDSELNGAVFSGAWADSFTASFINELGVMQRPRPDYDAKGLPLGGFRLFPVLQLGGGDNDNVFSTNSATDSDVFWTINPTLSLRSQWGRDAVGIYGGSQTTLYDKFSSENITNWDVGSWGRIDILDHSDIRANVYYDSLHEARTSPDEPGFVAKPTAFSLFHSDLAMDLRPNRFGITVGAAVDQYNFDNTPLVGGGLLDNSGRNEDVYNVYSRASYDFSPGYSAFVGASYDDRNFIKAFDINGFDRDSNGYHINIGSKFFINHLVQGQVFFGYLDESFKAPLKSVSAFDYGANINWYASPRWTVHFGLDHTIDDTTVIGASAIDNVVAYGSVEYELQRNIILIGQVGYTDQKFIGTARHDKDPGAGLQVTWLINHNMSLSGQYQYGHRATDAFGQDYTQNTFMLATKLQL